MSFLPHAMQRKRSEVGQEHVKQTENALRHIITPEERLSALGEKNVPYGTVVCGPVTLLIRVILQRI